MATITTTTNATPFQFPGQTLVARNSAATSNGAVLIAVVKLSTADNYGFFKSTDNGGSWTSIATVVRTNLVDLGQIYLDAYNWCFWVYRTNESSQDRIYVRRLNTQDGSFNPSGETLFGSAGNGGVAGAVYSGVDIRTHYLSSNNFHYVAVAVGTNIGANQGVTMLAGLVNPQAQLTSANQYINGTRQWLHAATVGRVGPTLDKEHGGDGYNGTPNLWCAFGRSDLYVIKLSWNGSGWTGPSSDTRLYASLGSPNQVSGRWDGTRFMIAVPDPQNTSQVMVLERNRANSSTVIHRTGNHTTGVVRNCTLAYDPSTGNVRVWAVGTSTAVLYANDYTRGTDSWGGWGSTGVTVLGASGDNYGAKPSSYGDAKWGPYWAVTGAPNTLSYVSTALSYAPNTPTWVTPQNGAAADVGATLALDWNFTDQDPGDTQSAFAVSRQIGAGALSYWRASDLTWQATEQQNTSSSTALNLAAGWAAASDANYTFKVKVWDSNSNPSGYSAPMIVVPSTPVNPVITQPTSAQVWGSSQLTVIWTAAEQSQYRVQLAVQGGATVFDSGWIGDTVSRSYLIPYVMATGGSWTVTLFTANVEGLSSAAQTKNFTTNFTAPPSPTIVLTPSASTGVITATITNPAPAGAQPAFATQDLYRRPITTGQTPLNSNPFFETDVSGWTAVNCTFARSTAQFHQGAAAGLITPNGVSAAAYAESTPTFVLVDGTTVMRARGWIRPTTANKPVSVYLHWYTAGNAFISSTIVTAPAVATTWLFMSVDAAPVPTAGKVSCALGLSSTPAGTDTAYVDEVMLMTADTNNGVRVGAGLPAGAVVNDFKVVSGIAYEYRAVVTSTTGVTSYGPWTA